MFKRKFGEQKEKPKKEVKSCKRTIKRDNQGRVIREEFIGCSNEQMQSFKDNEEPKD